MSHPFPRARNLFQPLWVTFVLVVLLAGCGQKGDLYRPGKTRALAAQPDLSHRG